MSGVTVTANSITVSTTSNYNTVINTSGPVLKVPGDFSLRATLIGNPVGSTYLTLARRLPPS